ncbi:MAG: hypothetical protein IJX58_02450 [Clostridia bacterium]|nr:hypothetical protein [Clostridia bacterium]
MKSTKILALILVVVMCVSMLASCGLFGKKKCDGHVDANDDGKCDKCDENYQDGQDVDDGTVTYNTYTSVMPSNWNELTYQDNNDTQIMGYIASSFFEYDYKFLGDKYNADGSINAEAIVPGAFTTHYSAATKLEDVTSTVDAKWGYTDEQKAAGGFAWKITLRDDLKWDDGTAITAADFEYSMKEQLNPKFMNYRGNTYYDTLRIKNSKEYFFSGAPIYENAPWLVYDPETEWFTAESYLTEYSIGEDGYAYVTINGEQVPLWISTSLANNCFGADWGFIYNDYGYGPAGYFYKPYEGETGEGVELPEYVVSKEVPVDADDDGNPDVDADGNKITETVYYEDIYVKLEAKENEFGAFQATAQDMADIEALSQNFAPFGGDWNLFVFQFMGYGDEVDWETVGIYAIEEENAIVICLDTNYSLLNEDGSLSVWAPYYMSSLPLVHKAKYEANKHEPKEGASLWTSTYNSSLDSTASWGPYKLVEFESGSHYKLVKNEHWYGWDMEQYKNQYNIDAVSCRKVEEFATSWMGFLNGDYDSASLQTENYDDYKDSKYVTYETTTGTYGMQLFSDLKVLKASENNNGILAIQEFRHALNLALNRNDIVEKIWPGSTVPCFGLLNTMYFYDIENGSSLDDGGIYRNTTEAKQAILRAYGFSESNGKWSNGTLNGLTLDEAYESLTGYNMTLAKQKMVEAINILTADADYYGYDASKPITIVYGSSSDTDKQRFRCEYLQGVVNEITAGTALDGKIVLKFDASAGNGWADAFRSGKTQIGFGYGFTGNAFNPFDIIGAFVNPDDSLNYHEYWDTSSIDMTLTMPAGDYEGAGETITMSLQNWYYCLNGLAEQYEQVETYNWNAGYAPSNARLAILAALEEIVLKESRSVMLIGDAGGSFLGAQFSYVNYDYNTFMGYGGMRYMVVEYTDFEWNQFVKSNGNDLTNEYKKSE